MVGVDWDAGRIAVAQQVAQAHNQNLSFIHQDARTPIQFQGHMVMLDLLHYINDDDQRRLLETVAASIAPGGVAVIRQCPRDSSNRFKLTNVVERLAHALHWHKGSTINFPTRETIAKSFRARALPKKSSRCGVGRRSTIICSCFVALRTMIRRAAPPQHRHHPSMGRRPVQRASGRVRSGTCPWK